MPSIIESVLQEATSNVNIEDLANFFRDNMSPEEIKSLKNDFVGSIDYSIHRGNPFSYIQNVLGARYWSGQQRLFESLRDNQRTIARSGHGNGKSWAIAAAVNWFFDSYDPSITMTTAPTQKSVEDVLWREIRTQRGGRNMLPRSPRMETSPNHFAYGIVAKIPDAFQGRHEHAVMAAIDEASGVIKPVWEAIKSMINTPDDRLVAILNPLTPNCAAYQEEQTGLYNVVILSCLDHPNIVAELAGIEPPFPAAVRLNFVERSIIESTIPIDNLDSVRRGVDIEFPPGSGLWFRPSPDFESRVLGRYPTSSALSVWSDGAIKFAEETRFDVPDFKSKAVVDEFMEKHGAPEIGCDPARFGLNSTAIAIRWGRSIIYAEKYQGLDTAYSAGRLKSLCAEWAQKIGLDKYRIPVKIDDTGIGGALTDQAHEGNDRTKERYNFIPVNAASKAIRQSRYSNKRAELWETTALMAEKGEIEWSRLSQAHRKEIRAQCMAQTYGYDARGRKFMTAKEKVEKDTGMSPDLADAINLACTGYWREEKEEKEISASDKLFDRHADYYKRSRKTNKFWMIPA